MTGISESGFRNLTEYDNRFLMVCYSSGVVAVFLVFFLLNCNAYRQRVMLALEPEDLYDIGTALRGHGASTIIGLTSIALALSLPMSHFGWSGMIFALEGQVQGANGWIRGSRREKRFSSRGDAR